MVTGYENGHPIEYDVSINRWVYSNDKTPVENNSRPCSKCGELPTEEGHDYCISNLPGVLNACCGHGIENEGYIMFENGITQYS